MKHMLDSTGKFSTKTIYISTHSSPVANSPAQILSLSASSEVKNEERSVRFSSNRSATMRPKTV